MDASTAERRFWAMVRRKGTDGCWPWQATTTQGGYGIFRVDSNRRCSAARFAYELTHGKIPVTLQVIHLCHNKVCCNPAHLVVGTAQENLLHDSVSNKLQSNSPSSVVGVHWRSSHNAYRATGTLDGKARTLYQGPSREKAIEMRRQRENSIKESRLKFIFNQPNLEN